METDKPSSQKRRQQSSLDRLSRASGQLLLLCIGLLLASCTHIQNYGTIPVVPDKNNVFVLTPPPENLKLYDPSVAEQWKRTYNHCVQVKNAIAREIDQREAQLSRRQGWLLTLGGLAGFSNSLYAALEENPRKEVTVPLGIISGTALINFLPSVAGDERLENLKEKLARLNALQSQAEEALMNVDTALLDKALLDQDFDRERSAERKELIEKKIEETTKRVDTLTRILKETLTKWSIEAR